MHPADPKGELGYAQLKFLIDTNLVGKETAEALTRKRVEVAAMGLRDTADKDRKGKFADPAEKKKREDEFLDRSKEFKAAQLETLNAVNMLDQAVLTQELTQFPIDGYGAMSQPEIEAEMKKLFPDNTFGPSAMGPGKVSVNGKFDIAASALRRIPPSDRNMLLHALSDQGTKQEQDAVIKELGKSGSLRLRFPEHAKAGKDFLDGQKLDKKYQDQLDRLYGVGSVPAPLGDQFRAFDIKNKSGLSAEMAKRGLEFALRMGATDLSELVDCFDFYEKSCAEEVAARVKVLRQTDAKSSDKELKRKAEKEVKGRQAKSGDIPDDEFNAIKKEFDAFKSAVVDTAVGTSAVGVTQHPTDFAANSKQLVAAAGKLCFGKITTAAYHTYKHYGELDASECKTGIGKNDYEDKVLSYHGGARDAVVATAYLGAQATQSGGEKHKFKRLNCTAIVWMNGGAAGLATYFSL